jgi:hypothetical protein
MSMDRRDFLKFLLSTAIAESIDVEKLLWTPKSIIVVPELPSSLYGIPFTTNTMLPSGIWLGIDWGKNSILEEPSSIRGRSNYARKDTKGMQEELRKAIVDCINQNHGIKAVKLAMNVMSVINPQRFHAEDYHKEIDSLVADGEIIELEYMVPEIEYRIKSIYFPKGTKIVSYSS